VQAGETELEGEIAQRDRISPTRQVPSQLIWRDREAVKFERAAVKQPTGAFRWTRKNTLFDNRKAGKSTPITCVPITVGQGAMVWITYKFARVEQNCGRKAAYSIV